jgi:hypothetical protein
MERMSIATSRKLDPWSRVSRNAQIVSARGGGDSWATIERRFGVSARQARRIVKDVGTCTPDTAIMDPVEIVEAAVMRCEALISQLAEIADVADKPVVAVNAIRAQIRVTESEVVLLQNAGMLPIPLSIVGYQLDAQRAASRAVQVLDRHGVSLEAKEELLAALRGQ